MVFKFQIGPETALKGEALVFWEKTFPEQSPGRIYRMLKRNLPYREENEVVEFTVFKDDLFDLRMKFFKGGEAHSEFNFSFDTKPGRDSCGIVEPKVSQRAAGTMTTVMRNMSEVWEQLGVHIITIWTGFIGSYASTKFGLAPHAITMLNPTVPENLELYRSQISEEKYEQVHALLQSGDQKAIWEIADMDEQVVKPDGQNAKLGQALLIGVFWQGSMDLDDPATRERFDSYTQARSRVLA